MEISIIGEVVSNSFVIVSGIIKLSGLVNFARLARPDSLRMKGGERKVSEVWDRLFTRFYFTKIF
ncbi:MAG: hypothetical protein ACUZ8H_08555 [Candidatus Anammoxibacter sp.]